MIRLSAQEMKYVLVDELICFAHLIEVLLFEFRDIGLGLLVVAQQAVDQP